MEWTVYLYYVACTAYIKVTQPYYKDLKYDSFDEFMALKNYGYTWWEERYQKHLKK